MEITEPGTIDDLVADATEAGHTVTHRLVHDWVSKGLLDKPQRRRTGPSGSEKGLHTSNQRNLFLLLLRQRAATPKIPLLARVPLAMWLYYGDHLAPTRQALQALRTYVGDPRGSRAWALERAREQIAPLDDPRLGTPRTRRELLHAVRDAFYAGSVDREMLLSKATPLFEPADIHRSVIHSHSGTAPATPETLLFELQVVVAGGQMISTGEVTADLLETVRQIWRKTALWSAPKASSPTASTYIEPTYEQIANCGNRLLFAVGAHSFRPR